MSRKPPPEADATSVGNVAQAFAGLSRQQLARAVKHQRLNPHLRLGEALVQCGMLTTDELDHLLQRQQRLRRQPARADVRRILDYAQQRATEAVRDLEALRRAVEGDE